MSNPQQNQINEAPAVSLDSADYLTDRKTLKQYEKIQLDHLNQPSWLGRMVGRPAVRRFLRDVIRLIMLLIALAVAAFLIYYLEQDASMAFGD